MITDEEKNNVKNNNNNDGNNESFIINMTEIEKSQNLTTENEYIKNEFIDINKRIENIKKRLNLINDDNVKKKKIKK